MGLPRVPEWRKLPLSLTELCIDTTLRRVGNRFVGKNLTTNGLFSAQLLCKTLTLRRTCSLRGRILALKQDETYLHYRAIFPESGARDDTEELLRHYFDLKHNLGALYEQWSQADPNFKKRAPKFTGVRILNQDAWEALICFICSSNNNISRISQMAHKLCTHYGNPLGSYNSESYFDFPTPEALTAKGVESHLRELGFGYRARYIADTAKMVVNDLPDGWLNDLRNPESPAWDAGPGGKNEGGAAKLLTASASWGWAGGESVPVDTHVWQIAQRDYKFGGSKSKTFTKAMYDAVGDHFRELWGKQAGWAHSVLFTADLKSFAEQGKGKAVKKTEVKEKVKVGEDGEGNVKVEVMTEKEVLLAVPPRGKKRPTPVPEVKKEEAKEGPNGKDLMAFPLRTTRSMKRRRTQVYA